MIIGLAGFKGSGKDTVADLLVEEYGFVKLCFADSLRQMLLIIDPEISFDDMWGINCHRLSQIIDDLGWNEAKRQIPEVRRLMQVTGTEGIRTFFGEDAWVNLLDAKIQEDVDYVVPDCRFLNELQYVHRNHGDVVWVDRPGFSSDGHASESDTIKKYCDYIFNNDSTVDELLEDVRFMMFMRGINPDERITTIQS